MFEPLYRLSMHTLLIAQLFLLLTVANGAPVVAKKILGRRFAWPLDGGAKFFDGHPLFGASKTVRGVALAVVATAIAAPILGLTWKIGAVIGAFAMIGDLASSFVKRRLNRPLHSRATGIDQIPESLLPLLAVTCELSLSALDVIAGTAAFFAGEILLSRLLYRVRLRDRPY